MHRPPWLRPIPSLVVLLLAAVAVAGCDADSPPTPTDGRPATLAGTSWVVLSVAGQPPPPGAEATMAFDSAAVQGSAGCNTYGGTYRYDPVTGELRLRELGMTAMACAAAPRMLLEARFSQALAPASHAVSTDPDGNLVLTGAGGRIVLAAVGPTVTD